MEIKLKVRQSSISLFETNIVSTYVPTKSPRWLLYKKLKFRNIKPYSKWLF